MKENRIETSLGTVDLDVEYGWYEGEIEIPLFKDNDESIEFPMYDDKVDYSDLNGSIKRERSGCGKETKVDLCINCPDDEAKVSPSQTEVIEFIDKNREAIENAVYENIHQVSDIYVDDYTMCDSEATDENKETMRNFFSNKEVAKSCFTLSSIAILGASEEGEGQFALNFHTCWDEEHGFAMRFKGTNFEEHAGASEFYDW